MLLQNWYLGDDRSMLIPNTLFRMGGAAMILTNRLTEYGRAKYELQHVVRVHLGADDMAYECASCYLPPLACLDMATIDYSLREAVRAVLLSCRHPYVHLAG